MNPLEEATTQELLVELGGRFRTGGLLVATVTTLETQNRYEEKFWVYAKGSPTMLIGLASRALDELAEKARDEAEPGDGDDE